MAIGSRCHEIFKDNGFKYFLTDAFSDTQYKEEYEDPVEMYSLMASVVNAFGCCKTYLLTENQVTQKENKRLLSSHYVNQSFHNSIAF